MTPATFEDMDWQARPSGRGPCRWSAIATRVDGATVHFNLEFWPGGRVVTEISTISAGGRMHTDKTEELRPADAMLDAALAFDRHAALVAQTADA